MDTAALLDRLRSLAGERQVPLNQLYMNTLRQAFGHHMGLDEPACRNWISRALGRVGSWDSPALEWTKEDNEFPDVWSLLSLGDVCSLDQQGTGSFYTPHSIAGFMSGHALREVMKCRFDHQAPLVDRFFDGQFLLPSEASELQELMRKLRILDLACGNGVFLNACLDWYCALSKYSGADTAGCLFVSVSLCGVDIREDALQSWAINLGCRSPELFDGIYGLKTACISSVEGDVVLKVPWVSEILESGGFDLVIGNPPYLGEKGNRKLFEKLRDSSFGEKYYEGRMDLFYYFLHRGIDLLKDGGMLCQLTTSYYATADFASRLRRHLQSAGGIKGLVSFNDQRVFAGAKGHHLVLFYQKGRPEGSAELITFTGSKRLSAYDFEDMSFETDGMLYKRYTVEDRKSLFDEQGQIVLDPSRWDSDLLERLNRACPEKLRDLVRINQGIVSGADRSETGGIFVLEPGEVFDGVEPWLVPWYKNGDIRRYRTSPETAKRLIYLGNEEECSLPPQVLSHFQPHREKLSRRRECQSGARPWYGLQWPREREIFDGPKLVSPQRCSENRFAYAQGPWFASADVYFLTRPVQGISLWALLAYLNSDIMLHWFLHCGKRKGRQLELYATPLGNVPVNRQWLLDGGELEQLGKVLYDTTDEALVGNLREQVENWFEGKLSKT